MLDGRAKIVDLFPAFLRSARDDHVSLSSRLGCNAIHDIRGRIGFGGEDEEYFVILMVEFTERGEVSFKTGFDALAWA